MLGPGVSLSQYFNANKPRPGRVNLSGRQVRKEDLWTCMQHLDG